ncbi:MAG: hypothetical protein EXQ69_09675 [Acidimicrobiia bacterium]|nr:hypothetical protein [Acidimicrobiia bacterium]
MNRIEDYFEPLKNNPGVEIGVTDWFLLDQPKNDVFLHLAQDFQSIYSDPVWCNEHLHIEPLVHPFLMLSMHAGEEHKLGIPIRTTQQVATFNYGYDQVSWHRPVDVRTPIRVRITINQVHEKRPRHYLVSMQILWETKGNNEPALEASALQYFWPPEDGHSVWGERKQ